MPPKAATTPLKKTIAAGQLRDLINPGGSGGFNSSPHTGWRSGEIQNQIGTKNKDKKKLVMDIWYEYFHDTAQTYLWSVRYRLKAEDKKLVGSGWNLVGSLVSIAYNIKYKQGTAAAVIKAATVSLSGQSDATGTLFSGTAASTAHLPNFISKTVTGVRSGGPSGISIVF